MSKKFKITICSGTTCYVMGGASLMMLGDIMPAELKESVEITGSTCLQECRKSDTQKPPFVKVNDELICEASINKIIDYLRAH